MSGARTTTASATRTRFHRSRREQEGQGVVALPAPRRQLPALGHGPLPAQPELRQRGGCRQAAGPQWLTMDEAIKHCAAGLGIWEWASNDRGAEPDVVMACCGDVPTLETLAAVDLLYAPELKVRVINVVNALEAAAMSEHPHGLSDHDFDALFTTDKPIIFAVPRLPVADSPPDLPAHRSWKPPRARLQGGEGATSTPFDMCAERPRSFPPGERRDRPRPRARRTRRLRQAGHPQLDDGAQGVHRAVRRRHARDHGLAMGAGRGICESAPRRPTTSEPAGGGRERFRDQARRDRVGNRRAAHGHDGHPVDR